MPNGLPSWHSLSSWELSDLCCRSRILPFSWSHSLGLLVVWSSVRRWPDTRESETIRQNKVEDSIMLVKADNLQVKKIHNIDQIRFFKPKQALSPGTPNRQYPNTFLTLCFIKVISLPGLMCRGEGLTRLSLQRRMKGRIDWQVFIPLLWAWLWTEQWISNELWISKRAKKAIN